MKGSTAMLAKKLSRNGVFNPVKVGNFLYFLFFGPVLAVFGVGSVWRPKMAAKPRCCAMRSSSTVRILFSQPTCWTMAAIRSHKS